MNLDKADVCKECQCEIGDVKPGTFKTQNTQAEIEKKTPAKVTNHKQNFAIILLGIILFPVSWGVIYLWNWIDLIFNEAEYYGGWTISLYAFLISFCGVVVGLLVEYFKSDKQKLIDIEFDEDPTSICPHCGSHNVKVYRKGYDYSKGLKWTLFGGGKYGRYVAGMDSNTACCRCMNCGKDWETDYDYRLL
jgi:hypothetical protein